MTYISGYDPASALWIVGPATEYGTIAERVAEFAEAAEARAEAERLNAADKLP